jgi:hypothetical protein
VLVADLKQAHEAWLPAYVAGDGKSNGKGGL